MRRGRAVLRAMAAKPALDEPRLDQLFTEPIVQQLMHRDRIDEATTRRQLRQAAVAQLTPRTGGVLAVAMGLLLLIGICNACNITIRTLRRCWD
jgi:hypothetical protein